jgi:hypothetical protein
VVGGETSSGLCKASGQLSLQLFVNVISHAGTDQVGQLRMGENYLSRQFDKAVIILGEAAGDAGAAQDGVSLSELEQWVLHPEVRNLDSDVAADVLGGQEHCCVWSCVGDAGGYASGGGLVVQNHDGVEGQAGASARMGLQLPWGGLLSWFYPRHRPRDTGSLIGIQPVLYAGKVKNGSPGRIQTG